VQEANAAKIRMDLGITTGEQEAMEYNGSNFNENLQQRGREEQARMDAMPKQEVQSNNGGE
jgi:hypothetical protein